MVNFNDDLAKPMITGLQPRYQRAFDTRAPKEADDFLEAATASLDSFRDLIVEKMKFSEVSRKLLNDQISAQKRKLVRIHSAMTRQISRFRKEAHRTLKPSIANAMAPT